MANNVYAGNGGAGGIYVNDSYNFIADTYTLTVGNGGSAAYKSKGESGENTNFGSLVVYGGGAGGMIFAENSERVNGSSGGSGGGGGQYTARRYGAFGDTLDSSQGSNGGNPRFYSGGNKVTESDITGLNVKFANSNVSAIQNTGAGGLGAVCTAQNHSAIVSSQTRTCQSGAKGIVVVRVPKNASITTTGTVVTKDVANLTPSSTKYVFITSNPTLVLSDYSGGDDLPSLGYTAYRKLGSITIDSSGHITAFTRAVDNQPWT